MERLIVARIGRRYAGWLTGHLSEVRPMPAVAPLPEPYPLLLGTAFLSGRLVTVVDTFPLMGETSEPTEKGLLLRLASPHDHIGFPLPEIQSVLDYSDLRLREESAGGIWAGLYPWEDAWVSVVHPPAVVRELARSMASAIHPHVPGRDHAS